MKRAPCQVAGDVALASLAVLGDEAAGVCVICVCVCVVFCRMLGTRAPSTTEGRSVCSTCAPMAAAHNPARPMPEPSSSTNLPTSLEASSSCSIFTNKKVPSQTTNPVAAAGLQSSSKKFGSVKSSFSRSRLATAICTPFTSARIRSFPFSAMITSLLMVTHPTKIRLLSLSVMTPLSKRNDCLFFAAYPRISRVIRVRTSTRGKIARTNPDKLR
mmetsp:Transcript_15256/g.25811  ORF Transcript_15256/g.25811 Transcript_15256/m.25811 type:complete len:215 (+) Transcript_15256:58-702(+)